MQDFDGGSTVPSQVCITTASRAPLPPLPTPNAQDDRAYPAISLLEYFGLGCLANKLLAEDGVHHLGNLLSLSPDTGFQFTHLYLWFEATDVVCS